MKLCQCVWKQATRSTLHRCDGLEGVLDKTTCGISLPVYRSKSVVSQSQSTFISFKTSATLALTLKGVCLAIYGASRQTRSHPDNYNDHSNALVKKQNETKQQQQQQKDTDRFLCPSFTSRFKLLHLLVLCSDLLKIFFYVRVLFHHFYTTHNTKKHKK